MKKLIATAVLAITLTACSSTSNLFVSAVNGAYVVEANGGLVETIQKANLSESENARLFLAKAKFDRVVDDFKSYESDPLKFAQEIHSLTVRWDILKSVYERDIYDIVEMHFDEYSADEQQVLEEAHKALSSIAKEIDDLVLKLKYAEASNKVGSFATTLAKIYFLKGA